MALIDCSESSDNELFVVEGLSAANALSSVRDRRCQAVLPMQGKIPNARRTSLEKMLQHAQVDELLRSIRPDQQVETSLTRFSFERVVLLSDPDADGLHAGLLLLLFLSTHIPALVEQGRLFTVRAPLCGFYQNDECVALAYTDKHAMTIADELAETYSVAPARRRFKGVASLDHNLRYSLMEKDNPTRHQLTMVECQQLCQLIAM